MSADINFPKGCVICSYYFAPDEAPQAMCYSAGIGGICPECTVHTERAVKAIKAAGGFAPWPLPDHQRRNNSTIINCTKMHQRLGRRSSPEGGSEKA